MCGNMVDIKSAAAEIGRGKKRRITGVPQTRQQISAAGGQKFTVLTVLSGHVGLEEELLFNKFFSSEDIVRQI